MENSIKVLKQIEQTHKGLGVPILFGNICLIGSLSPMYIGEVGTGKGTSIKAIENPYNKLFDINMNSITLTMLAQKLSMVRNQTIVWRLPEWSTLTRYHREVFLTIGSHIISDHEYYHPLGEQTNKHQLAIDIKDCNLVSIVGIQPLKMARMMRENENWESLATDRFLKFAMFNPLRTDTIESIPKYKMPEYDLIPNMPINSPMILIKKIVGNQVSDERLPIFCRRLLRSYCLVEGYDTVTVQAEIEFCKLFRPYLEIYPSMIYTQDIEEEKTFASGAYRLFLLISKHQGATLEEIRDKFRIYNTIAKPSRFTQESYDKMIMRHAQMLWKNGWAYATKNSPTRFYLSQKLNDYFDWYRSVAN